MTTNGDVPDAHAVHTPSTPAIRPLNLFFDVDFTLITWDYRLRPHVREVFTRLRAEGHTIYLWSGMGKRWEIVDRHGLHEWVADCFNKPLYDHRRRMGELEVTVAPDYVVDDHREIVDVFGGYHIREAQTPLDGDEEMLRVEESIRELALRLAREEGGR